MEKEESKLTIVFIPSLISILMDAENSKGSPLIEDEVISIRDSSTIMEIPIEALLPLEESRGYIDIMPENCWNEWQERRKEFS